MSWALVGGDPAPASPDAVGRIEKNIRGTADDAEFACDELRRIGQSCGEIKFEGEAAEAFKDAFDDIIPDLQRMANSYQDAAQALARFEATLRELKREAKAALNRAELAEQQRANATAQVADGKRLLSSLSSSLNAAQRLERTLAAQAQAEAAAGSPNLVATQQELQRAAERSRDLGRQHSQTSTDLRSDQNREQDAQHDLAQERRACDRIRDRYVSAERACASGIEEALADALHNKSLFEKGVRALAEVAMFVACPTAFLLSHLDDIKQWIKEHADLIFMLRKILIVLSTIVGVILLVTGVGAPLGLLLLSAGLALATLGTGLALKWVGDKRVSNWDIAFDVFGVVTSGFSAVKGVRMFTAGGGVVNAKSATSMRSFLSFRDMDEVARMKELGRFRYEVTRLREQATTLKQFVTGERTVTAARPVVVNGQLYSETTRPSGIVVVNKGILLPGGGPGSSAVNDYVFKTLGPSVSVGPRVGAGPAVESFVGITDTIVNVPKTGIDGVKLPKDVIELFEPYKTGGAVLAPVAGRP